MTLGQLLKIKMRRSGVMYPMMASMEYYRLLREDPDKLNEEIGIKTKKKITKTKT